MTRVGEIAVPDWTVRASFASSLIRALRRSVSRDEFFAGLLILALVNGIGSRASQSLKPLDLLGLAAAGLHVSAIVWFACFAALSLVLRSAGDEQIKTVDAFMGIAILFLVAVPLPETSWFALAAVALYVFRTSLGGSKMRRGAFILLAVTVPMCWGPLLLDALPTPFLWIDAVLVSNLIGTQQSGNLVKFVDGSGYFQIFPLCSSYHNISLAVLAWISVGQFVEHKWSPKDLLWCLLAVFSVLIVNTVRLGLIGLYRNHFETIHGTFGSTIADYVSLTLVVVICLWGLRREIFACH
jgi:exosortase/archaeosortase family protein